MTQGRIAPGSNGAGLVRRAYRRSPARWLRTTAWAHRGLRPADVFVASYPRSGSVWLRFLLMEMTIGDANFKELRHRLPELGRQRRDGVLVVNGGRFIKTHEPFDRRYRRAIHLVRDPRDVTLSYFRFMQRIGKIVLRPTDDEAASLDRFIDAFIAGRVDAHGTWQSHLLSWARAAREGRSDVLRLRYEDLAADTPRAVQDIAGWLDIELGRDEVLRVVERCSLDQMRQRERERDANLDDEAIRNVPRRDIGVVDRGRVGGWRGRLTDDQAARFAAFAEGLELMGYQPA